MPFSDTKKFGHLGHEVSVLIKHIELVFGILYQRFNVAV